MAGGYDSKAPKPSDAVAAAAKAAYQRTTARLDRIAKQVADAPRSASLKDKVCIITGVGSLKGIG